MIELLDPHNIKPRASHIWVDAGWSYCLDYSWLVEEALAHGGKLVLDVGCGVAPFSPLGNYIATSIGAKCIGIDRQINGMDFMRYTPPSPPDIIFWASSLEHNDTFQMSALYHRSMDMLAPGGLFLATITIAKETFWFAPSANTCLSEEDACLVFQEPEMLGNYDDVWQAYRNDQFMMNKYRARYGHFDSVDPVFLIAGVAKTKELQ